MEDKEKMPRNTVNRSFYSVTENNEIVAKRPQWVYAGVESGALVLRGVTSADERKTIKSTGPLAIYAPGQWLGCEWITEDMEAPCK